MKVIEPGEQGFKRWSKQLRCTGAGNAQRGCNALLQVDYEDLRYWQGVYGDSWGTSDPAVAFKCPICFTVTDLKRDDWPNQPRVLPKFTTQWRDENYAENITRIEAGK